MKKIALIALITGTLLAAAAYITAFYGLPGAQELRTPGFIGYILIISALASFSLDLLYEWNKKEETWQS